VVCGHVVQGDFDKEGDSEEADNLADTIMPFPGECIFKIVARKEDSADVEAEMIAIMEGVQGMSYAKRDDWQTD
jgi:hypothetical protein